jgi:Domain of unknown function (DUF4815)
MDFNSEPFWDDFDATNGAKEQNYMRILFRPGYAVQARELTQIQSILQNQIKQFGDHIFADGSPVIGGHLSIDTNVPYIKLNKQYNSVDIDLDDFYGLVVFNNGYPRTRAKTIQTYSTETDSAILIKYLRGPGFSAGENISTASGSTATIQSSAFTGTGSVVSINSGVFYVGGFFVYVEPQTIVLDPYSSTPTYRIGLEIDESIITESEDAALLDPAQESFNYQAPGAHRYQYSLVLTKRSLTSVDDSRFFELLRVENGVITKQVSYPIYSELEKTLARRTYDESGDYTVRPFVADISANTSNSSEIIINIGPGKAYVKGTEFETIGTTKITLPKARQTKSSSGFNLSGYYGNRLIVSNVSSSGAASSFYSESLPWIDIHSVPNNSVSLSGDSAAYYATKIGSAKIKNVERTSDVNSYYLYLTDIDFQPILTTANVTSANASSVNLKSHFSSAANAYLNAQITLISTTGAVGNVSTVVSYDNTNKIAVVYPPFAAVPQSGDRISLSMSIDATRALMTPNMTTSFATANLQMNVASLGKDVQGNAVLEDSLYDSSVFSLPSYYVKYGSDTGVQLYRKLLIRDTFVTAGSNSNVTISLSTASQGTFDFGTSGATVSTADIRENIVVLANNGQILDMTSGGRSVYKVDGSTIILDAKNPFGSSFLGDILVTTKVVNANGSLRRTKTLVQSNTANITSITPSSATDVVGTTNFVKIDTANGVAWFMNSGSIVTNTYERQPLYVPDVVKIRAIYDSGSLSYAPNATNKIDITSNYLLDSGQKDNYYDHASIRLKPDAQPPKGQTAVFFDYYTHVGSGYLSSNSYSQTIYDTEMIPVYRNETGSILYLRDSIDNRPVRAIGTASNPYYQIALNARVNVVSGGVTVLANVARSGNTLTPPITVGNIIKIGSDIRTVNSVVNTNALTVSTPFSTSLSDSIPYTLVQNSNFSGAVTNRPTDPITLNYEFYLPRIDKIVVTKDKEFKLLSGIPNQAPMEPLEDSLSSMPIYKIYVPAYTPSIRNVSLEFVENKRYTMRDIGAIESRIKAIEEYVQLKESENEVINQPIPSPITKAPKPIYGTVVDEFIDLSVVDTSSDFSAAIENGMLSCYRHVTELPLKVSNEATSKIGSKFVMLPYTEAVVIEQNLATTDGLEPVVSDSMIAKFNGYVTLTPESDYFYSKEHLPTLSDIMGRFYSLPQQVKVDTAALTSAIVTAMGGAGYADYYYSNPALLGTAVNISDQYNITVPAVSSDPSQIEPTTTNEVSRDFVGVMPSTALNSTWTGADQTVSAGDPNAFDPYQSEIQGSYYRNANQFYGYK